MFAQLFDQDVIEFDAAVQTQCDLGNQVWSSCGSRLGVSRLWKREIAAALAPTTASPVNVRSYTPSRSKPHSLVKMSRSPGRLLTVVGDQMVPLSRRRSSAEVVDLGYLPYPDVTGAHLVAMTGRLVIAGAALVSGAVVGGEFQSIAPPPLL